MPIQSCKVNGKSGFKWGSGGTCYTHDGSEAGKKQARKKAVKQGLAIGGGKLEKSVAAPAATSSPTYAERPWWVPHDTRT